ncbi:MAG: DUF2911 domain-containing protein [Chitinophagaceae bacterium]|nr:DUF2911 domain-containing protein [Chitinophagaceae bacterium]
MKTILLVLFASVLAVSCNNGNDNSTITDKNKDDTVTIRPDNSINPFDPTDISPMDMSYYPVDYPQMKMSKATTELPKARVIYSRPHLGGRRLFQNLLNYNEPWRLGANEATEIDFYKGVTIQNKKIKAGRYILYCIPEKENWTIVLNNNIDSWGLHPDASQDIARFQIPVTTTTSSLEFFTMYFKEKNNVTELVMAWDYLEARLPISF